MTAPTTTFAPRQYRAWPVSRSGEQTRGWDCRMFQTTLVPPRLKPFSTMTLWFFMPDRAYQNERSSWSDRSVKSRTRPFYRLYPSRLPLGVVDRRCAISHDWRYVYARIPKAANSTVIATLHAAETGRMHLSEDEIKAVKLGYARPSQLRRRELARLRADYFKFSFVRNPYTRLVSAYLDKVHGPSRSSKRHVVARALKRSLDVEIDFSDFLDYLEFENGLFENAHWARQVDLLLMPPEAFGFIGRVEALAKELPHVLERIFGAGSNVITWAPHSTAASTRLDILGDAARRRVARLYEADFDCFAYPTGL